MSIPQDLVPSIQTFLKFNDGLYATDEIFEVFAQQLFQRLEDEYNKLREDAITTELMSELKEENEELPNRDKFPK